MLHQISLGTMAGLLFICMALISDIDARYFPETCYYSRFCKQHISYVMSIADPKMTFYCCEQVRLA